MMFDVGGAALGQALGIGGQAFDLDPTAVKDGWVRISGVKH